MLHSICQQIWKIQPWPWDWKMSILIPIPKKGSAKEYSNHLTIVLISHASKVMLKILHARLQHYANQELPDVHKKESESEVSQSYPTLCDSMDCSLSHSSIHGIFQARVLEWVAISFSRGSSQPRDWTWDSRIVGRCFTVWATREVRKGLTFHNL